MRSSLSFSFRVGLLSSSLFLAACGQPAVDPEVFPSAVRSESKACLAAEPVLIGTTLRAISGDTSRLPARPDWCGGGPAAYYTFTIAPTAPGATRPVMLFYADTLGSTIDATVGLLASGCERPPLVCGGPACGTAQSRIVQVIGPGTYHVIVAGRANRERGPFVLRLQAVEVPPPPYPETFADALARQIPRGDFELRGRITGFVGGWIGDCGRLPFAWWWYASCPSDAGLFSARAVEGTTFDAVLSWVDVDDGREVCAPHFGTAETPCVDTVDEPEGGLHVLKIGKTAIMGASPAEYVVTGHRL